MKYVWYHNKHNKDNTLLVKYEDNATVKQIKGDCFGNEAVLDAIVTMDRTDIKSYTIYDHRKNGNTVSDYLDNSYMAVYFDYKEEE